MYMYVHERTEHYSPLHLAEGMNSHRFFTSFVLIFHLAILLLPSSFADDSAKVTLSLYYETLCPFCADFIVNHLSKVLENGLINIINLRLVPWGNAFMEPDGSFSCQHGQDECLLNTVEACTITIYPDVVRHFNFIDCVERLTLEQRHSEWTNCLQQTGLGTVPTDCYNNGNGYAIEQRNYQETAQLNPPHQYVPWVVVNNHPLLEDYQNYMTHVCKAYKGSQVPEVCNSPMLELNSPENANLVCYKGKMS